jgi:antitoxin (DNA-binding transcriptional repressor) of toxin-antitoxin stability system
LRIIRRRRQRLIRAGETFVVTRNGEPVAELRPLRAGRRTFISRAEVAALAAANVRIDRDQFRNDLDAVIDQSWLDDLRDARYVGRH